MHTIIKLTNIPVLPMTTHFITAEINMQESVADLHQEISATLSNYGQPLRWAVTSVDAQQQTLALEAVVTTD